MAKVKRSVLKEIVKECLLEILFEGIDSEPGYEEEEVIREARRPKRRASRPSPKRNLAAAVEKRSNKDGAYLKNSIVESAVTELTDDPIMASIYADTAQTTLQEQRQSEGRRVPIDNAAAAMDSVEDVSDIFEGAGNWAAIAFGDTE